MSHNIQKPSQDSKPGWWYYYFLNQARRVYFNKSNGIWCMKAKENDD